MERNWRYNIMNGHPPVVGCFSSFPANMHFLKNTERFFVLFRNQIEHCSAQHRKLWINTNHKRQPRSREREWEKKWRNTMCYETIMTSNLIGNIFPFFFSIWEPMVLNYFVLSSRLSFGWLVSWLLLFWVNVCGFINRSRSWANDVN